MALRCDRCGKGVQYGHNVSHSKRRTKRLFKPNLHRARVTVGGVTKRMRLCTKCLRLVRGKSGKGEIQRPKVEKRKAVEKTLQVKEKEVAPATPAI